MANLLTRLTSRRGGERSISTIDDYTAAVGMYGYNGFEQTLATKRQPIGQGFIAHAGAAASNGPVATCMQIRQEVFSSPRFRWQRMRDGKAADYFSSRELRLLERPWVGGTTQALLARAVQDADLAGNSFWVRHAGELVRLRPDWVDVAVEERWVDGARVGWRKMGFVYYEGGRASNNDGAAFTADEVAHFMPKPDPLAEFRGMTWLTPVLREIEADQTMTRHKRKFFDNGATPNLIIKHAQGANRDKILDFQKRLDADSVGTGNAYRTLNLYPGADATIVGSTLQQIDFKAVQGAGETRIAAAAGVPVVIAGFSEGLQGSSLNAGNYGQARRRFADITMHPLWGNVAGAFEVLLSSPGSDVRLWYDASEVPFLREDEGDAANIAQTKAATITSLITAGYTPESVASAVEADDFRLLVHTGLYSVQLQKPGQNDPAAAPTPTEGVQP